MTRNIDIVIEILKSDVDKIFHSFKNEFYIDADSISEAIKHQGMFNIIHNESVFKIDFIIRKNSIYRKTEFQRRRRVRLDKAEIWIVSPEDLIISKLYWAKDNSSQMQINDVNNLLRSIKNLDNDYIQLWIEKLKLNHVFNVAKANA